MNEKLNIQNITDELAENYGINKKSVNNEQTKMPAVLIIRVAPEPSEQKSFKVIQIILSHLNMSALSIGHIDKFYHIRSNLTIYI